jgi:hypothetical protein
MDAPTSSPREGGLRASVSLLRRNRDFRRVYLSSVISLGGDWFLLVALFAGRMFETLSWFKQHFVAINRLSGSILLVMGVFLVMGRWVQLVTPVMRWYADHLNIG